MADQVEEFIRFRGEVERVQRDAVAAFLKGKRTRLLRRMLTACEDFWRDETGEGDYGRLEMAIRNELERRKVKLP